MKEQTRDLIVPIEIGGDEPIKQVTIRRPKARQMVEMERAAEDQSLTKMEVTIRTVAAMCGLTQEQAEELDFEDLTALSDMVADFFPGESNTDGGDSSQSAPTS